VSLEPSRLEFAKMERLTPKKEPLKDTGVFYVVSLFFASFKEQHQNQRANDAEEKYARANNERRKQVTPNNSDECQNNSLKQNKD
jgi:hypothetical protein